MCRAAMAAASSQPHRGLQRERHRRNDSEARERGPTVPRSSIESGQQTQDLEHRYKKQSIPCNSGRIRHDIVDLETHSLQKGRRSKLLLDSMGTLSIHKPAAGTVPASAWYKASIFGRCDWRRITDSAAIPGGRMEFPSTLSVATYNVWFESMVNDVRYPAVVKLVVATGADIICLQEVTQSFIRHLKADPAVRETYTCLGIEGETIGDSMFHGCLMLIKTKTLTVTQGTLDELPDTRDQRRLLSARVSGVPGAHTHNIRDVMVATAHLESTGAEYAVSARLRQLRYIKEKLPHSGAIFCGDMNLVTEGETRVPEKLGFHDAWTAAGHSADTPTSDALYKSMYTPRRLDRVLYTGDVLCTSEASLFGETPLQITQPVQMDLFLSDHIGVLVKLKL
jgi:endonuclease/exonuclease/phosphatase family metal-dependent hydrolase